MCPRCARWGAWSPEGESAHQVPDRRSRPVLEHRTRPRPIAYMGGDRPWATTYPRTTTAWPPSGSAGRCARPAHQRRASRRRLALHLGPADVGATGRHASSAIGTDACDAAFIGAPSDEGESACARTDRVVADLPVPVPVIRRGADAAISFDPVHDTIPGLDNYDWVRRLREPSYRVARSSRATSSRRF